MTFGNLLERCQAVGLRGSGVLEKPGVLEGVRFGMASAVVSSVVIVLSLRPIHKYKVALVAALLAIALVDSLADAYAIWTAWGDVESSIASMVTKIIVCGSLALMIGYAKGRPASASAQHSSSPSSPSRHRKKRSFAIPPRLIYLVLAIYVSAQLILTIVTKHDIPPTLILFVVAVGLSFVIKTIVDRVEK